jgi:hypothetical protein
MTSRPVYRTVLGVDVEQSSRRPNPVKEKLRCETYRILQAAMRAVGIQNCHCDPFVDRGDGVLVLIRPVDEVPKTLLLNPLLPVLCSLLTDYNVSLPAAQCSGCRLRLRAIIHSGEVHRDDNGPFGETLDVACRLLDSSRLKRYLKSTNEPLVLAVSDDIYRSIVLHGYEGISPAAFEPAIWVRAGNRRTRGWVHVPTIAVNLDRSHLAAAV